MRLRKKWWARPEMEQNSKVKMLPKEFNGKWQQEFNNNNPIYLELGCGRGKFISDMAELNPDINFIGIDLKDEVLVRALRSVEAKEVENVRLIPMDITTIPDVFAKDEISRIYINFCNPWPKNSHKKRRLTHTRFLEKYKGFIKPQSEVWFKTDDTGLFEESVEYFENSGFEIKYITRDLHDTDFTDSIQTEYETKFMSFGMKIMFLIAKLR